jgi:hypothetical protein
MQVQRQTVDVVFSTKYRLSVTRNAAGSMQRLPKERQQVFLYRHDGEVIDIDGYDYVGKAVCEAAAISFKKLNQLTKSPALHPSEICSRAFLGNRFAKDWP